MTNIIINLFLLFLPIHLANGSPVVFGFIPFLKFLKTPVDNGHSLYGKRIFGDHKTWLGILSGTITGLLFGYLFSHISGFQSFHSYPVFSMIGGFLAILGDMFKSFIKRRLDIKPGKPWIPFDQIDYLIFVLPLAIIFYSLPLTDIIIVIIQGFILSVVVSYSSYLIGIKEKFF